MNQRTSLPLAIAVAGWSLLAQQVQAIVLNFTSTSGGQLNFLGANNFNFTPAGIAGFQGNNSFIITSTTGLNSAVGDVGTMTSPLGGWTFNPGSGCVSGEGTLDIIDPMDSHLTAVLTWCQLDVNSTGTGGQLNQGLTLNLSNIIYAGVDPDLIAFASLGTAAETVLWTFSSSGHTLSNLGSVAQSIGFTGSLEPGVGPCDCPDGGLTLALLVFSLATIEGARRKVD